METLPRYLSPVSIIPGGCPQFLDLSAPVEALRKLRRHFREEKRPADDGAGRYRH